MPGLWFRRGRLLICSPVMQPSWPPSGRKSTYPIVQSCRATSLNPVENIWQFMRDNWLSNRVFTSHDNIVDQCCEARNKLIDQPLHIMTIGRRHWARAS